MNASHTHIAQSIVSRLNAGGIQVGQVEQTEIDGNVEITITACELGLKSLTVRMKEIEVSRPLVEDFNLLGEDEGFTDHVDYSPDAATPRELVLSADAEM
jgi:hypothetical protein